MNNKVKKHFKRYAISLSIACLFLFLFVSKVNAGLDLGVEYAAQIGLGTSDLRSTIANVLNIALGFLGILAVVIILYGGFIYMTAAGEEEKVTRAKNIITQGAIGLGIILSAFAITAFIFNVLLGGTLGTNNGGTQGGTGGSGGGFNGGGTGGSGGDILSGCPDPIPNDSSPFICELSGESGYVEDVVTIQGGKFGITGEVFFVSTKYATDDTTKKLMTEDKLRPLINEAACNDPDKCLEAEVLSCGAKSTWTNNQIVVAVPAVKKDSQYYVVVKTINSGESNLSLDKDTDKGSGRNDDYTVKDGAPGPGIICLLPDTGKVGEAVSVIGRRFGEISGAVKFRNILANVTTGNWTNEEIKTTVPTGTYTGKVTVTRGKKKSNGVLYKVSCSFSEPTNTTAECASGCCNTLMCVEPKFCNNSCLADTDCPAGMICGASGRCEQDLPGGGQSCGEIDGDICSVNTSCRAGNVCNLDSKSPAFCKCDPVPVILDVEPKDGAPGNFVTVYGVNFGAFGAQSKVVFLGDLNDNSDDVVALPPEKCGAATNTWEVDSVIVEVPLSAKSGPIKIITASGQSDDTINEDSQGLVMTPLIADENKGFIINEVKRPGLCFLTKSGDVSNASVDEGYFRDGVDFFGINFAVANQDIKPLIGNTPLNGSFKIATISNYDAITDGQVPNLVPNKSYYDAQVKVGNEYSNPVDFKILNPADLPSISYIEATKGPKGQYVSIVGAGFGSTPGKLTFDPATGDTVVGSGTGPLFNFPASCSLTSTWTNNNIIFTVPDVAGISSENNLASISVTNSIGLTNPREENAKFTICEKNETDCQLTPGICAIKPNQGPVGTRVQVFGNGFGAYNPESSALIFSETKPVNVASITSCLNDLDCISQYWTNVLVGKSLTNDDPEGVFASVPSKAVSGPVRIDVASGDDVVSTPGVWFEVSDCRKTADLCGQDGRGPVCCKITGQCMTDAQAATECKTTSVVPSRINYEYYTGVKTNSPGTPTVVVDSSCDIVTQSPSPFIDSKDACKGAAVSARFVNQAGEPVPMPDDDFSDYFNENSVQVFECGTSEIFNQENCSASQVSGSFEPLITIKDSFVDGFKFNPDTDYNLNTWYFVKLISGPSAIRSNEGLWLDGNNDGVTTSGDDFAWSFRTGNDSAACKFDKLQILPNRVIVKEINGTADYSASVLAQNCNILNSNNFDWTWESQKQNGSPDIDVAGVTNNNLMPVNKDGVVIGTFVDPQQTATALGQGVAFIGATAFYNQLEVGLTDFNNKFIVDLDVPEVTNITHDNGFIHPAVDSVVTITGKNFGYSKNNSKVFFGNSEAQLAQCVNSWTDNKIQVVAPKPALKIGSSALPRQTSNISIYSNILEESGVAYYNFNSSSNVEVVDDFGDSDGVIYTAEKSSEAIEGLSLKLSNGYVEIPSAEFKLTDGSVSLWFKSTKTSSTADETLFNAGNFSIDLGKDNSIVVYTGDAISTYENSIPRGEWVNLVYTSVKGKGAIYINGRLIEVASGDYDNTNFTGGLNLENNKFIYIGATKTGDVVSKQFTGLIDLVTITNKGITSSDVKKIAGFINDQGVLTELNFDNQGNDIIDSGNIKNKFISTNYPLSVEGYSNFGKSFSKDGNSWRYLNDQSSYVYNQGVTLAFWAKGVDLDSSVQTVYTDSYNGGLEFSLGKTGNCGGKDICFTARGYNKNGVATNFYAAANRPDGFDESDWHLYIGVLDIENKNISLYIDGGLIDSENEIVANATFALDLDNFEIIYQYPVTGNCIGGSYSLNGLTPECGNQNSGNTDSALVGVLDNFVIYNYVLSDKQIGTLSGVSSESIVHVLTSGGSSIGSADPVFTKSDNIYPFLCNLAPNFGTKGAAINASGVNFGDSFKQLIGNDSYYNGSNVFHDLIILSYEAIRTWANKSVVFANPFDNQPIPYRNVTIQIDPYSEIFKDIGTPANGIWDGLESYFEINDNTSYDKRTYDGASKLVSNPQKFYFSPVITSLSPDNGPIGQWVTISGYNFGQQLDEYGDIVPGKVYFSGADGLIEAQVVTNICVNQASWSNKSIIAQVPAGAVSGDVLVETENGAEAGLLSNPSKFDINNKPLGPGISCIDPNHVSRFGGDVSIRGVRFGSTGSDDNVVVDGSSKLGTLNSIWSNNLSLTTRDDLSIGTHGVQIKQRTFVGQECAGFSIGAFCPGGKVDVYEDIFSNSVPLDVSPICEYGLIGKQGSVALNWPLNTGYSTEHIGVDGGYVYILNNQSIVRFSNGSSGTTLREIKTYIKDSSSASSISSTKSFFALKGNLYSVSSGNSIQEISLDEKLSTYKVKNIDLTSRNLIDLVWGTELGAEYKVTANSNYIISLGLANSENKSLRFVSGGQPRSATYGGYWMRVYNPSNDFALVKDVFISDVKLIADADIASIIAEDDYLYVITKQGVVRVIDLKSNNFYEMDGQLLEWSMGDDGDISGELNGQWDPRTGNIYMGVSSSELQPDKLYRYYGCMAGNGCRTNADCTACGAAVSSCVNGTCTPIITKVTPPAAAVGDYVTIKGCYLGNDKSVCFTKNGSTGDAICGAGFILGKRVAPICGNTTDTKIAVVEVPNLDANNDETDDAQTGPVKVVVRGIDRDQNAYTRTVQTFDTTSITPTSLEKSSSSPYYSFGVKDFIVDNSIVQPTVCGLTPNEGLAGSNVQVNGEGFGNELTPNFDKVVFKGNSSTEADNIEGKNYIKCSGGTNSWSSTKICLQVPLDAVTGAVEVTNEKIESTNEIEYEVYSVTDGPVVRSTNPSENSASVCTNSLVEIQFTTEVNSTTLDGNIFLKECSNSAPFAKKGRIARFVSAIKELVLHKGSAQVSNSTLTCNINVPIKSITSRSYEGGSLVTITPDGVLSPQTLHRVDIGEGIRSLDGVLINQRRVENDTKDSSPLANRKFVLLDTVDNDDNLLKFVNTGLSVGDIIRTSNYEFMRVNAISGNDVTVVRGYFGTPSSITKDSNLFLEDEFTFATKGSKNLVNSGICKFDDIEVSVYSDSNSNGIVAQKDSFMCTGNNCKLVFDYDQAPGPRNDGPSEYAANNQHKYVARATSEVNDTTSYTDRFERSTLVTNDLSFITNGSCPVTDFTINNGSLVKTGSCALADSLVLATKDSKNNIVPKIFPRLTSAKVEAMILSSTAKSGLLVNGNIVSREIVIGSGTRDYQYVVQGSSGRWVSSKIPLPVGETLPSSSRWEVEMINGRMTLKVDGLQVIPDKNPVNSNPNVIFSNSGKYGFYTEGLSMVWDDYKLTLEDYNILQGHYTWSRSDLTDPKRLVTIRPDIISGQVQDLLPTDQDKIKSTGGIIYSEVSPESLGQTKIVIEATTDAGEASNTVSKEFPINIFLCSNPWPDFNAQFTDTAFNFLTYYCRDNGNAENIQDTLPDANIVQKCEYKAGNTNWNTAQCLNFKNGGYVCNQDSICAK